MKQFNAGDIRNFAIVGHGATGKTSLAESMLVLGGEIIRPCLITILEKKRDKYLFIQLPFIWNGLIKNLI